MTKELHIQILEVVALIPYGTVASYGQIAQLAGLPKHVRLVGYVLKHLDPESDLPWHRVINAQGKISTNRLNAHGENIQQIKLLEEDVVVVAGKVSLKKYQWS